MLTSIPSELVEFLESGISILVGTRDAHLRPEFARGIGARIHPGGSELTVWIAASTAELTLANVRDNARLAVCFAAIDHRSFQFKGRAIDVRDAHPDERAIVERYRAAIALHWGQVGMPPRLTHRMIVWPAHALTLRVESVFQQTPGPGAGAALGKPRRGRKS